jgi:hypothetical protein
MAEASRESGPTKASHYKAFSGERSPALNYSEDCLARRTKIERGCKKRRGGDLSFADEA